MKRSDLRTITFNEKDLTTNIWSQCPGLFHEWWESKSAPWYDGRSTNLVAIIETIEGYIKLVPYERIQFVEES